jgi:hypothetical protein
VEEIGPSLEQPPDLTGKLLLSCLLEHPAADGDLTGGKEDQRQQSKDGKKS